jgi:pSer/pThr/pTyr-binding forkhead associated (FHA) protein
MIPADVQDGDILQLGVDYQGGQEDMYRCVKMRVELGRDWQRAASEGMSSLPMDRLRRAELALRTAASVSSP